MSALSKEEPNMRTESVNSPCRLSSFIFIFLILIANAGAQSSEIELDNQVITAQFSQGYDLKRTCSNNGTYCSTSAVCNLTVISPNGNIVVSNAKMTNQLSFHNKTFTENNLNQLGRHYSSMTCTDSGGAISGSGMKNFYLDITADGKPYQSFPSELYILLLGLILIVLGKIKKELSSMQNIGAIILMIVGIITLYPGYSFINYSTLLGQTIGITSVGLGFWFLIERGMSHDTQTKNYDADDDGRYHD